MCALRTSNWQLQLSTFSFQLSTLVGAVGLCLCALPASAQPPVSGPASRKQATATRVANGSVRVDGRLDDEAWLKAAPITDFIQKEPVENAAPTDRMEVRLLYDDDSLYVGARMFSADGRIQARRLASFQRLAADLASR